MRPLGQFPPWGGTKVAPTSHAGFRPKANTPPATTQNAEQANWIVDQIGQWKRYRDAIEVKNWAIAGNRSGLSNLAPDSFAYDATRGWYLMGGQIISGAFLYYSSDAGLTWHRLGTSTLPSSVSSDEGLNYQVAVSADGRWLAWLSHTAGVIGVQKVFFNANAGIDVWTASTAQPTTLITHAYWTQDDNRFIVCGNNTSTFVNEVWSVDIGTDTWNALTLTDSTTDSLTFGCGNDGNRLVATTSKLWRTSSVASNFKPVTVPWTDPLLGLVWCPGPLVFVAVTAGALYSSPNGVVWSRISTPPGVVFTGPVAALGDTVLAAATLACPDGIAIDTFLCGTDALRTWSFCPSPYQVGAMIMAGGHLASLDTASQPTVAYSMGVL